eukprot:3119901-Amphidinium_carterae.1
MESCVCSMWEAASTGRIFVDIFLCSPFLAGSLGIDKLALIASFCPRGDDTVPLKRKRRYELSAHVQLRSLTRKPNVLRTCFTKASHKVWCGNSL